MCNNESKVHSVFFRYFGRTPTWGELLQIRVTEFFCLFEFFFLRPKFQKNMAPKKSKVKKPNVLYLLLVFLKTLKTEA